MVFAGAPQFSVATSGRPPSAVWLVDKPVGATSASVVEAFRAAHRGNFTLKVSHGGVLDPFADGLLVLLVGAANRLFDALHEVPKRYVATVAWGRETETGDAAGATVLEADPQALTPQRLEAALAAMVGPQRQTPPNTSNKRVDGERAYVRAHRGERFTLPAQPVVLHEARWLSHALPRASVLEVSVSAGFYVRSLAIDLGRGLGVGAHLAALRRTQLGPWAPPPRPLQLTGREVLPWLPVRELDDAAWGALRASGEPSTSVTESTRALHRGRLVAWLRPGQTVLLPGGV